MIVNIAGAGAGKTTRMADLITEFSIPDGKIVFCIAFSNTATDNIAAKVSQKVGKVPYNIRISTIHSFLYQEFVLPFYSLLYGKHFKSLSAAELPDTFKYKAKKLSELEREDILHYTKIPEKAKWVADHKSGDTKAIKETRKNILSWFSSYCAAIFVDEAQDMSEDISATLTSLNKAGVNIILYGDPKQDIKGLGCFQKLAEESKSITYIAECYRCPQKHLNISNMLATANEKQTAHGINSVGAIKLSFESDIDDIKEYVSLGDYGLCYISKKHPRFATHESSNCNIIDTLYREIYQIMASKWFSKYTNIEINRAAYFVAERMQADYNASNNPSPAILRWVSNGTLPKLEKSQYAQICKILNTKEIANTQDVVVNSIESIKGLESSRCLFILTTDLAPYFFQEKVDNNKMRHMLYVALTRSSDYLEILITKETESSYSRKSIIDFFAKHCFEITFD